MPVHVASRWFLRSLVVALAVAPMAALAQDAPAPRVFAPGVETVIPVELSPADTTSVHDVVELRAEAGLEWKPEFQTESRTLFNKAAEARFNRELWQLEFGFKPLRMIFIDVPQASGETERKLVWYLVYRVKNTGETLVPSASEVGEMSFAKGEGEAIRYLPHFVLQGHDTAPNGGRIYRAYLDKVIPAAVEPIRLRETPGRKLLGSVAMSAEPIAVGEERWGVAMWENIDPEMDFFSVYARGLTNAYRWTDPPGAYEAGDPPGKGREFAHKTLQLNFWRPGDRFLQHESEVRYGVPVGKADLYGVDEGVAHRWVFR
ncbi:hypothetical protein Mal64_15600 [Pseudobythopirellula maris]|uniref:Uncharacterized protein n=1 Tax=Pseudobythopirellula maris TaxID=2527991 RepID=A0A5C5ZLJ8_9BACT|nr:hypothetical protein [Pseudobythopirellula maris]TWT88088.1 hypothetical protein Mal64_15600 [Pseudobythopirellula maris]